MLVLAVAMGACAIIGLIFQGIGFVRPGIDDLAWKHLLQSGIITAIIGLALYQMGRLGRVERKMNRKEATLSVVTIWVVACIVGAIPFVLNGNLSLVDAFFESTSGFTTTGATTLADIEAHSRPLLLWRALTQWLGGMGIVVLFVAIFPSVGIAAKHMFRHEATGPSPEDLQPRITETSMSLWKLYVLFTCCAFFALWAAGMHSFDAICHAFTVMATGGFSTQNASIGGFSSARIEWIIIVFMLIGTVNFGLYYLALRGRGWTVFWKSTEFRAFVYVVITATAITCIGILPQHQYNILESLRSALFSVVTVVSTTGYDTDNHMLYGPALMALLLILIVVGGSAGSTSGGIKLSRILILFRFAKTQVRRSIRPSVIQTVRLDHRPLSDEVLGEVSNLFFITLALLALGTLGVASMEDLPVATAFGAAFTSLFNHGPAPFYEGVDTFVRYSAGTKLLCCGGMILGRLEVFTVLAIFLPDLWKR